jgi:hypothetical protein
MKKYAGLALGVLMGIAVGVMFGYRCGQPCDKVEVVAEPVAVVAPSELPSPELQQQEQVAVQAYQLHQQELDSGKTYSTGSIGLAQQALEQLLEEYDRQSQDSSGPETPGLAMGKAVAHARLARIALAQGDPMEYERHLAIALELSGESSEESLFRKIDQLDQAQQEPVANP